MISVRRVLRPTVRYNEICCAYAFILCWASERLFHDLRTGGLEQCCCVPLPPLCFGERWRALDGNQEVPLLIPFASVYDVN